MLKKPAVWGRAALLAAALIWGSSFIVMKDTVDAVPVFLLLAVRFTLGSVLISLLFFRRLMKMTAANLRHGAVIGVLMFLAYVFQTIGLTDTTPGKNAFLTAIYCVAVPFICWVLFRRIPTRWNWIAAVMCMGGVGLVSLDGDLSIRMGDALTLVGGVLFSLHMVAVSHWGEKEDPIVLTIVQFITAAVCCWFAVAITGETQLETLNGTWPQLLYLTVFATVAAMIFQNVGQSVVSASSASILLSFESVFAVAFSLLLGAEQLTLRVGAGFGLIFLAVLASETQFSFLHIGKRKT